MGGGAVWGLVRSAQTEDPGRLVLADIDGPVGESVVAAVLAVGEPQVILRDKVAYAARLHASRAVDGVLALPDGEGPWRLGLCGKGTFENLLLEPIPNPDASLAPGQVRIAVAAMAANFRDVMITLGLYPDDDAVMGVEASGVVIETSSTVGRFAVGDRVAGIFPEGVGSVASTDERLLLAIPDRWSYIDAA